MGKSVVWVSLADYGSRHDNREMFSLKTTLWFFIFFCRLLLQCLLTHVHPCVALCLGVMCAHAIHSQVYLYMGRHTDQTNLSKETCDGVSTCKLDPLFAAEAKQAVLTIHSDVIWENLISVCGGWGNVVQPDWGIPATHSESNIQEGHWQLQYIIFLIQSYTWNEG